MSTRDFFDPPWESTSIVLVDEGTMRMAERWIKSCEGCSPDKAQMPFDWILDRVTACRPSVTDYVLERPARCPRCKGAVSEKTLVDLRDDDFGGDGAGSLATGHDVCHENSLGRTAFTRGRQQCRHFSGRLLVH